MPKKSREALKQFFETGDTPTSSDFGDLIDSTIISEDDGIWASTGKLGIGVEDPKNALEVYGDTRIGKGLNQEDIVPVDGLLVQGDVRIGRQEAPSKLELSGELLFSGSTPVNKVSKNLDQTEVSDLSLPTEKAVKTYVDNVKDYVDELLIGAVMAFAMTGPPEGWLACNGQAVSRETHQRLYKKIGTQFGAGNGSTTFNVPDIRGEFVRGWDGGPGGSRGADPDRNGRRTRTGHTGNYLGSYQGHMFRHHGHNINTRQDDWNVSGGSGPSWGADNGPYRAYHGVAGNGGNETRPRNIALLYCIKT